VRESDADAIRAARKKPLEPPNVFQADCFSVLL